MLGIGHIFLPIFWFFLIQGAIIFVIQIKKPWLSIILIGIYCFILGIIISDINKTTLAFDQVYRSNQSEIELKNQKIGDLEQQIKILQDRK
jgi:hypothetical protein